MPEEIKGLLRAVLKESDDIRTLVSQLDSDVKRLADSERRSLWERIAIVVVLLVSIVLVALYVYDSIGRRADFRERLRDLACLAVRRTPPGVNGTVDDLRHQYDCPPFHAVPASSPVPGRTVTSTRSSTVTATATASATTTATATATATVHAAARTLVVPGPTSTVTKRRTVTKVVTRTVTASPSRCLLVLAC